MFCVPFSVGRLVPFFIGTSLRCTLISLKDERNKISLPLTFLFCLSPLVMAMSEREHFSGQEGDLISR